MSLNSQKNLHGCCWKGHNSVIIQFIFSSHICTCKAHKPLPDLSTWTWKCQWHKHTNSVRNQTFQLPLLSCHPIKRLTGGHTSSVTPRVTIVGALPCLGAFILWKKPYGNPEHGTVPGTPCCGGTSQEKKQDLQRETLSTDRAQALPWPGSDGVSWGPGVEVTPRE